MAQVSINCDYGEWGSCLDAGERAHLLQSPCVDTAPKSDGETSPRSVARGTTSTLGAIFIVVNACLGAGLLNFPAAFSTAGGVAAGVTLQMVSVEEDRLGKVGTRSLSPKEGARSGSSGVAPHDHTWQSIGATSISVYWVTFSHTWGTMQY